MAKAGSYPDDGPRIGARCVRDQLSEVAVIGLGQLGLAGLIEQRVRLANHGANGGTKALTVIGSMLLGGDSVADTALLAAGATGELFDQLRAPSTIGSWLRAFT